jgi:hypothetical protein
MIVLVSFLLIVLIVTALTSTYIEGFETSTTQIPTDTTNPASTQSTTNNTSVPTPTPATSPASTQSTTNNTSVPTPTQAQATTNITDPKYVNELVNKQNSDKEIVTIEPGTSDYLPNSSLSSLDNHTIIHATTLQKTPAMMRGFCEQNKNNPLELDKKCSSFDSNMCASTNCCVLLGGDSCVAGNDNGPFHKEHYLKIKNRDYYYYQGKCYGNCH